MNAPARFRPSAIVSALAAHGVDFVVIGGIALVGHGSGRNTFDLDITYATDGANLDALGAALVGLDAHRHGVADEVPFVPDGATLRRTWILTLDTREGKLDVLAAPPGAPPYEELRRSATRAVVDGVGVLLASLDDLEAMKRAAGRPKDELDLEEIQVIRRLEARRGR